MKFVNAIVWEEKLKIWYVYKDNDNNRKKLTWSLGSDEPKVIRTDCCVCEAVIWRSPLCAGSWGFNHGPEPPIKSFKQKQQFFKIMPNNLKSNRLHKTTQEAHLYYLRHLNWFIKRGPLCSQNKCWNKLQYRIIWFYKHVGKKDHYLPFENLVKTWILFTQG